MTTTLNEAIDNASEPEVKPGRGGNRRLTAAEWMRAKVLFNEGKMRTKDLAKHFGITREAMSRGLKKRGAVYGMNSEKRAQKAVDGAEEDIGLIIMRAKETKDEHYRFSKFYANLAAKKVSEAEKNPDNYGDAEQQLRTILAAMKINGEARRERFAILGLDKEVSLSDAVPELVIREMEEEEIVEIRENQEEDMFELEPFNEGDDDEIEEDGDFMDDEEVMND